MITDQVAGISITLRSLIQCRTLEYRVVAIHLPAGLSCKRKPASMKVTAPAEAATRRNARERRRVQAVNGAFMRLRRVVACQ